MIEGLFFVLLVLVVLLAIVGLLTVSGSTETERQRYAREAREAERRIAEIGHQAQAMILAEALKRAQHKPTATRTDRHGGDSRDPKGSADGPFGPWDD